MRIRRHCVTFSTNGKKTDACQRRFFACRTAREACILRARDRLNIYFLAQLGVEKILQLLMMRRQIHELIFQVFF
ncbi:hypothetical protein EDC32_1011445 [Laceyella sacchari]|nr:hypothetical protein EDC32_1011445 [Laceyella sacchari]